MMRSASSTGLGAHSMFLTSFAMVQALGLARAAAPAPISVPIDESKWIGYDGTWSPITLQIGTPVQAVDLFPSTAGQETLVIGVQGCDGTMECDNFRGGIFASNQSSTFKSSGDYDLGLDHNLGMSGAGYYGLDTVMIGNHGSLKNQIVGIVNSTDYWTGFFGLGTANTTLGTSVTTSFLESLAGGSSPMIPSLSYGLTFGAHYRLKQVPCSLTLGGYDMNRFTPNEASFTLDDNQKPTLALNALSMKGFQNGGNISFMEDSDQALFTIDSTTPFLWLPESVADKIGEQLGLVYNDTLNVFLYSNMSQYTAVTGSSLSFSFGFADLPGKPVALSLDVDGQAFTSLNLTFGFPGLDESSSAAPVPYFPVRKAANSTQYSIGRAFLQETYLIVDYQRNNFSLSQAQFSEDANVVTNIASINPPSNATDSGGPGNNSVAAPPSNGLPTGAIVGIAVAVVVLLVLIICTLALCLIRRHYAKKVIHVRPNERRPEPRRGVSRFLFGDYKVAELAAREFAPSPTEQMAEKSADPIRDPRIAGYYHNEKHRPLIPGIPLGQHNELPGTGVPATELPGSPVQRYRELVSPLSPAARWARFSTQPPLGHRPKAPIELPTRKSGLDETAMLRKPASQQSLVDQPSPASSVGPIGTFLTVSALDSSSDSGPSPQSPYATEGFELHSEKSFVSPVAQTAASGATSPTALLPVADSGKKRSRLNFRNRSTNAGSASHSQQCSRKASKGIGKTASQMVSRSKTANQQGSGTSDAAGLGKWSSATATAMGASHAGGTHSRGASSSDQPNVPTSARPPLPHKNSWSADGRDPSDQSGNSGSGASAARLDVPLPARPSLPRKNSWSTNGRNASDQSAQSGSGTSGAVSSLSAGASKDGQSASTAATAPLPGPVPRAIGTSALVHPVPGAGYVPPPPPPPPKAPRPGEEPEGRPSFAADISGDEAEESPVLGRKGFGFQRPSRGGSTAEIQMPRRTAMQQPAQTVQRAERALPELPPAAATEAAGEGEEVETTYMIDDRAKVHIDARQLRNAPKAGKKKSSGEDLRGYWK